MRKTSFRETTNILRRKTSFCEMANILRRKTSFHESQTNILRHREQKYQAVQILTANSHKSNQKKFQAIVSFKSNKLCDRSNSESASFCHLPPILGSATSDSILQALASFNNNKQMPIISFTIEPLKERLLNLEPPKERSLKRIIHSNLGHCLKSNHIGSKLPSDSKESKEQQKLHWPEDSNELKELHQLEANHIGSKLPSDSIESKERQKPHLLEDSNELHQLETNHISSKLPSDSIELKERQKPHWLEDSNELKELHQLIEEPEPLEPELEPLELEHLTLRQVSAKEINKEKCCQIKLQRTLEMLLNQASATTANTVEPSSSQMPKMVPNAAGSMIERE